jgi:hypothetical protein
VKLIKFLFSPGEECYWPVFCRRKNMRRGKSKRENITEKGRKGKIKGKIGDKG